MKGKSKRKFTSEFKLTVVLEVLKEKDTLATISKRHELHPNQISDWIGPPKRKQFLLGAASVFETGAKSPIANQDPEATLLYEEIGRLQMELTFFKKKLSVRVKLVNFNTMEAEWCCGVLRKALGSYPQPEIFNTDQGSQFTSDDFTAVLLSQNIRISMDGKGRALDNIFVERLWRTIKYEDIYLKAYQDGWQLEAGLQAYFEFYNCRRFHQSVNYRTPEQVLKGMKSSQTRIGNKIN